MAWAVQTRWGGEGVSQPLFFQLAAFFGSSRLDPDPPFSLGSRDPMGMKEILNFPSVPYFIFGLYSHFRSVPGFLWADGIVGSCGPLLIGAIFVCPERSRGDLCPLRVCGE